VHLLERKLQNHKNCYYGTPNPKELHGLADLSKTFTSTFRREELTAELTDERIRPRKCSWARAEAVWAHYTKLTDDPYRIVQDESPLIT
jgi:hypothetical protein